jgi:hypothetical protein
LAVPRNFTSLSILNQFALVIIGIHVLRAVLSVKVAVVYRLSKVRVPLGDWLCVPLQK